MAILEELIITLQDASRRGEAVIIPAQYIQPILTELRNASRDLHAHQELMEIQRQAVVRANRVFKRANKWPNYEYPDIALLIDWLLDQNSRLIASKMQTTLESVFDRLYALGQQSHTDLVTVPGWWVIGLRAMVRNTLAEVYERSTGYNNRQQNPKMVHKDIDK